MKLIDLAKEKYPSLKGWYVVRTKETPAAYMTGDSAADLTGTWEIIGVFGRREAKVALKNFLIIEAGKPQVAEFLSAEADKPRVAGVAYAPLMAEVAAAADIADFRYKMSSGTVSADVVKKGSGNTLKAVIAEQRATRMSSTKACAATLKAVAQDYRDNLKTLNADFKKDTANAKADLKECEIALKDFDRSAAKATGDKKPKAKVLKLKRKPTGKRQAKKSAPLKKAASTRKRP